MTIIFFIQQVLSMLNALDNDSPIKSGDLQSSIGYCKLVLAQLEQIKAFVQDLHDLRQLKLGTLVLAKEPFNIVRSIQWICESFACELKMNSLQLVAKVGGFLIYDSNGYVERKTKKFMPELIGDENRFKQVMFNLVKNAIKFTDHGVIEISANFDHRKRLLRVTVRDTGIGISKHE